MGGGIDMDKKSVKPLEELLDSVRDIDGFPLGKDEDILALSDPPFYTACPNPYIEEFIEEYGTPYDAENDDYDVDPYLDDVIEARSGGIYDAHTYYTKVPPKAIMKYIMHYTNPGDLIFDGFCGSGMTGVAAQITNRKAIIMDLSPAAAFISNGYNRYINPKSFKNIAEKLIDEVKNECSWIYKTKHEKGALNSKTKESVNYIIPKNSNNAYGIINYIVWSDIFICQNPECGSELIFYELAVNFESDTISPKFCCPYCNFMNDKIKSKRLYEKYYDSIINKEVKIAKQIPVLINYSLGKETYFKKPSKEDFTLINTIENMEIPFQVPRYKIPMGDNTKQPMNSHGLTHFHQFFKKRMLWVISCFWEKAKKYDNKNHLMFLLTSYMNTHATIMTNIYLRDGKFVLTNKSPNNLSIPSLGVEKNFIQGIESKIKAISGIYNEITKEEDVIISTSSITNTNIPNNSIDYIFIDPPFGKNINYSELSIFWDTWLGIFENKKYEAIMNDSQNKKIDDYEKLMTQAFTEMNRILKPGRWITIEFSSSKASIWNSIQRSISRAGFIISQVAVLDKQQKTFKQVTSPRSVKTDLIINAHKPKEEFTKALIQNAGEDMEVNFVRNQLENLPIQPNPGRTEDMLHSRTHAYYVENGFIIKYNPHNFYELLSKNFIELDGYWFLDSQVREYNEWKSKLSLDQLKNILDGQQILLITNEKSAIKWIYNFLVKPREYGEILSEYQQFTTTTADAIPEFREILDNNFIIENGKFRRPLDQKERKTINQNRAKELDRAFNRLLEQAKTQKSKIKNLRFEALIHGFTKCYQNGRYQDILTIADKLYANTLESNAEIMDFIDIARIKTSGDE